MCCPGDQCWLHVCTYRMNLYSKRKLCTPRHHQDLGEHNLMTGHNRRHLEDMIVSLSNHLLLPFKPTVRYARQYSVIHTKRDVAATNFAAHVLNESKLSVHLVRHAGKRTLKCFKMGISKIHSINYTFCVHTAKMTVCGQGNWES